MTNFGNLYTYNTSNGTVIPSVSEVQTVVETTMKEIFGSDFSVETETIGGRLVEAFTTFFKTVCAVNAQNAGMVNPKEAVGAYLDQIGALFGVSRTSGESDSNYRARIYASTAIGPGFAASISKAISNLSGTSQVVVLDNGLEDPQVLPLDEYGDSMPHSIAVDPHSVFISVLGGTDSEIAEAIMRTKSAGCGFTANPEYGTVRTIQYAEGGVTLFTAKVYTPRRLYVNVAITVRDDSYVGSDIVTETQEALVDYIGASSTNATIKQNDLVAYIASLGSGIVVDSVTFTVGDTSETITTESEMLVINPFRYVELATTDITVTVR